MKLFPSHPWEPQKFIHILLDNGQMISQQAYMKLLGDKLHYTTMEDWYNIDGDDLVANSGRPILLLHENAPNVVMRVFGDHAWDIWEFTKLKLPDGFWDIEANRDAYFKYLQKKLGITKLEDWYKVTRVSVPKYSRFLEGTSLLEVLKKKYKDHEWLPWKFHHVANNTWRDPSFQRRYIQYLKGKLRIKNPEDWYRVKVSDFRENDGGTLCRLFDDSCYKLLMTLYPELNLQPWRFKREWDKEYNKPFLVYLGEKLGYKTMEDWYRVSSKDILTNHGQGLLQMYSDFSKAIIDNFRHHPWEPWRFRHVKSYWKVQSNRVAFFNYLFKKLGYTKMDDWYKVKLSDFEEAGVRMGASKERASFTRVLMQTFPEHAWHEWRFRKFSLSAANHDQIKSYVASLGSFLGVRQKEEWYNVTYDQVKQHGAKGIKKMGLPKALQIAFPDHQWDSDRFVKGFTNTEKQRRILAMLEKSFPSAQIIENYTHPLLRFDSGGPVISDIFIPSLKLSLEYQGEQHTQLNPMFGNPEETHIPADAEKKRKLEELEYTHIQIPHWWDGKRSSLLSFIQMQRPDIHV
eukprot:Phypoly_transcript_04605.p1 GENE.Phypoly_transcript_04605~~Phypoly_transcript_04605.p1  ORF type:complete len:666 (+),score=84.92 Phypoly_transcript_04605:285-2000(+)